MKDLFIMLGVVAFVLLTPVLGRFFERCQAIFARKSGNNAEGAQKQRTKRRGC